MADRLSDIPAFVKEKRLAAGLTMKALAERAGMSEAAICYMEQGQRKTRVDSVTKVFAALGYELAAVKIRR
jgi:transcriptional regulator with XRE-family HTH domain